jgi:hypothetical protein
VRVGAGGHEDGFGLLLCLRGADADEREEDDGSQSHSNTAHVFLGVRTSRHVPAAARDTIGNTAREYKRGLAGIGIPPDLPVLL